MGAPLGFQQVGPVPPLKQDPGLRQPPGLGGVLGMDGRHAVGLYEYAIEQDDAEGQPEAPPQPRIARDFRHERRERTVQRVHARTLNVISIRFSPRAGSARTWSNSGTASRERT